MLKYEEDYNNLVNRVFEEGVWITNKRTGVRCLTVINHDFVYDVGAGEVPLLTNKQCFTVSAVAEVIGYWRRYSNAQQFADIGSPTWFSNANDNQAWLDNINRSGENDMGVVYGAATGYNDLQHIYDDLSQGLDNRGEIYQMWRPETFSKGCLRPCAYEHIWSLVGNKLSLTVVQRSADLPLGVPFNSFSFAALLKIMAQITGNVPDKVFHKLINVHIYENQIPAMKRQMSRTPLEGTQPVLEIADWVQDLNDVIVTDLHAREYFKLTGYEHQGKIAFPFTA
jgi:thymidylate synthase